MSAEHLPPTFPAPFRIVGDRPSDRPWTHLWMTDLRTGKVTLVPVGLDAAKLKVACAAQQLGISCEAAWDRLMTGASLSTRRYSRRLVELVPEIGGAA